MSLPRPRREPPPGAPTAYPLVVLTGASSGIGAASALALAALGTCLVLVARRPAELAVVAERVERLGSPAAVVPVDLRDHDAARAAAETVLAAHGLPDVVVANAGHSIARPVLECVDRFDSYERTSDVNYLGAVALALPLLRAMAERRRGHLVGVTTVNARVPVPGWSPYCASKAALDAWLRSVGPELRAHGVTTTIVKYPLVRTPMALPTYGPDPPLSMSPDARAQPMSRFRGNPYLVSGGDHEPTATSPAPSTHPPPSRRGAHPHGRMRGDPIEHLHLQEQHRHPSHHHRGHLPRSGGAWDGPTSHRRPGQLHRVPGRERLHKPGHGRQGSEWEDRRLMAQNL